jgi:hypothetical protein
MFAAAEGWPFCYYKAFVATQRQHVYRSIRCLLHIAKVGVVLLHRLNVTERHNKFR